MGRPGIRPVDDLLFLSGRKETQSMKVISPDHASIKIPIKIWTEDAEQGAIDQALNLANLPFAMKWIAIMPDTHQGYGMPIGGVIATNRVVIPNAVGVDIGCGMKARKTNLTEIDKETLKKVLNQIQRDIPTGFNHQKNPQPISQELGKLIDAFNSTVLDEVFKKIPYQLGTLGGGNHFIEIQKGNDGHIWIMLHSGSRGIGKMTCDYYNKVAEELNKKWFTGADKDLAYLPIDTKEGQDYLSAMKIGMQFAEDNRLHMLDKITQILLSHFPEMKYEEAIDTHHNYASMEHYYGADYLVHRKGAVRAQGKVIIPGSMGTFSYIAEGLNNPESFGSCSHGAGRVLGRKEATRRFKVEDVLAEMKEKNIELYKVKKDDVAEECASAYKDIDTVMENQKDLVKPLVKLHPLGVVKG